VFFAWKRATLATIFGACSFAVCPGADDPPELKREFRAAWVASVYNLDWPSRPGLSTAQQQAELRAIFERAAQVRLNAIVLQVRPECDAFYRSKREPWSSFLTGKMGRAPEPGYDPLEFAVSEAHARGLELHAWINPFRALANAARETPATHISRTHPEWVRRYGNQLWVDPGEEDAREYTLGVILDLVRRYDIDGIHIDDYFYPYPAKDRADFPDDGPWQRYKAKGGQLSRSDWRRENIDQFVASMYRAIKAEKRAVKVGISPFGIWRPGVPPSIEAQLDSFNHLFADSRKWLNEGWCDYFSPQLYWSILPAKQSFPVLLDWWRAENKAHRHVWPGIATDRIGPNRKAQEIESQIVITRTGSDAPGHIHWSFKALARNSGGVADVLAGSVYALPALVPPSPWLGGSTPAKPSVEISGGRLRWQTAAGGSVRWWLVQTKAGERWESRLLPASEKSLALDAKETVAAVRAINATGMLSEAGRNAPAAKK
jgi:uncharacterized lipoprotein YddW (UPF0748 family)